MTPGRPLLSRTELDRFRDTTVPDLIGPSTRLLFVGINPGLWTAAVQAHFARRGNRFYPALLAAGIIDHPIDASSGYSIADRGHLLERGIGITNLVPRATARADELTRADLTSGRQRLIELVTDVKPAVVAVLGVSAYRVSFERPKAEVGRQTETIGGVELWVAPNPSGLNAHASLASLAAAYREIALAAGICPIGGDAQ